MIRQTAIISCLWLTCTFGVQSASAADPHGYLALGDSLAFGFSPLVPLGDLSQYHGYPQLVAIARNLELSNASCFGETSGHFLRLKAEDLGCDAWRAVYPLFISHGGAQIDNIVPYLRSHPKTDLVTIDIGINDLGVLLRDCKLDIPCAQAGFPKVIADYQANLVTIYSRIRIQGGYKGPIVAVTAYAFNYAPDDVQTPAIAVLNSVLSYVTTQFGGKVADAFTAFGAVAGPGAVCPTGLLVKFPDNTCDTHPSPAGYQLIADLVTALL